MYLCALPLRPSLTKPRQTPFRRPGPSASARWRKHCVTVMRHHWQPVMRMWAALLLETEKDLRGRRDRWAYHEALVWVEEQDPTYSLTTFDGVCTQLDLDETYVRADLLKTAFAPRVVEAA